MKGGDYSMGAVQAARNLAHETASRATSERSGQSLVDSGIGLMVAVIVIGAVSIPVIQDVIEQVNLTGTAGTVLGYVPLALALALFVGAISLVR